MSSFCLATLLTMILMQFDHFVTRMQYASKTMGLGLFILHYANRLPFLIIMAVLTLAIYYGFPTVAIGLSILLWTMAVTCIILAARTQEHFTKGEK